MSVTKEEMIELIQNVEHPEIASTLDELGMLRDIDFDRETQKVSLTLVLPMMGIPESVRDMILNSIATAIGDRGSKLSVSLAEMNEEQRQKFFALSQKNWKL